MAHFAEIDTNNVVTNIIYIDNENITPGDNETEEQKRYYLFKKIVW